MRMIGTRVLRLPAAAPASKSRSSQAPSAGRWPLLVGSFASNSCPSAEKPSLRSGPQAFPRDDERGGDEGSSPLGATRLPFLSGNGDLVLHLLCKHGVFIRAPLPELSQRKQRWADGDCIAIPKVPWRLPSERNSET